jgi:hypothetical protein
VSRLHFLSFFSFLFPSPVGQSIPTLKPIG